jgi:hypothetical protein
VNRWHEYIPVWKPSVNKLGNTHWGDICQSLLQVLTPSEEGCGMLGFQRTSY